MEFAKAEHEGQAQETHSHYTELADQLANRLGVSKAPECC